MTALVRSSSKVSFIGDVKVNPIIQRNVMPIGFRNFCFFSQNHSTKYQKSHSQYNNLFSFKTNSPITFQKRYSSFDLANHAKTEKITIKTFNTLRKLMTQYTSEGKLDKVWELSYKYIKLGDKHQSLYVRIFLAHFIETNQFINTLKMLDLLKEENLYPFQQGFTIKIINYIRLHVKEYQKIIPAHQKPIEQHKIKAQPKENYAMKLYDFVQIVISKNLVDLTACKLFNLLVRDFADCGLYEQANNMINLMKANDIHILDEYIKSPLLISYINNYKPSDKPEEKTILIPKTILEGRDQNCSYHPIYLLLSKDQEINNNNNNNNNSEESYEEENEENPILQKKKLLSEYKQEIMKNVKYNLKDNILNLKTKLFELGNQITINKDSNNEEQKLEEDDELNHQYQSLFTRLIIHYCLSKKDSDIQEISLYTKTQKIEISQISLDLLIGYNIINNQYDQLSEIMEFPNVNIDLMKRSIVSVIDYFIDQSMWKELNNLLSNLIKLNQITTGFFNLIISSVILPFHRHSLDRFIEIMNILNIQSDLQTLCIIVDTYLQSSEFQKVELLIAHLISDTVDALDVKSSNTEEKKPIIREKKELEKLKKECQAVNRLTLKLMEKYFVKYNYLEIINFFQNDILPYARELHISEYVISNVLLSMMKLGKFQDFPSFFTKLSESGIKFQQLKIYNLLFKEIIKNNRPDIGKELVMKFINSGTTPNEHTYGHIIKIYAQNDEVDKSVSILRNMEKKFRNSSNNYILSSFY